MKIKKRIAMALIFVLLACLCAACGKQHKSDDGAKGSTVPGQTGTDAKQTLPALPGYKPGEPWKPIEAPTAATTVPVTEGKRYGSPDRIPVKTQGEDYTNYGIPDGVSEIYSVGGKLLFSYATRWVGDKQDKKTVDYYTLFEYHPANGSCSAVSEEVGYIMRVGDRFLYDKSGTIPGSINFWDVPYYCNSAAWNNEVEITGVMAQQLLYAPKTALIRGKVQPYAAQRVGTAVTVTLLETGEVISLRLDPKAAFGKKTPDGLTMDIRGVANETVYLSVACVPEEGMYVKELFALKLDGSGLSPVRYNKNPIWADPTSEIEDGFLYGISITDKGTALLKIDTAKNDVIHLATVKERVWHFVANDDYVLYEIPSKDLNKPNTLGSAKIEKG